MKGGAINNTTVGPDAWRNQLKSVQRNKPLGNNTTRKNNNKKAPWNMSKLSGTLNLDLLAQYYPNNTICKDPGSEESWALKYFTVSPGETVNDELIEMKIGDDMISKEPEKQCLGTESTYYKRLHDSGLVNFVIFNKDKAANDTKAAKYVVKAGAKSGNAPGPKLYVYRTPVIYMKDANGKYDKPSIGNKKLKLKPRDDAIGVKVLRVRDIANGTYAMPFLHVYFAREYYKKCNSTDLPKNLVEQLDVVYQLSRIRNHRIMKGVNDAVINQRRYLIDENNNKTDLGPAQPFAYDFNDTPSLPEVQVLAQKYGVNINKYTDTSNDTAEIAGCSSVDWNLTINVKNDVMDKKTGAIDYNKLDNLKIGKGNASDTVPIITDLNGDDWFVLIIRGNAPGKGNYAWPGGFVDEKETFAEAAKREFDEEVGGASEISTGASDVNVETAITDLGTTIQLDWDPRIKVYNGMTVGATVFHNYFFPKNANGGNNKSMRQYKCAKPSTQ